MVAGFFSWEGWGSPHMVKILSIPPPPHPTLVPVFGPRLVPPAEVRPKKFEKFKYIFVSNLTQAQKYLKKLYFMLKIAKKMLNFALGGHV